MQSLKPRLTWLPIGQNWVCGRHYYTEDGIKVWDTFVTGIGDSPKEAYRNWEEKSNTKGKPTKFNNILGKIKGWFE